MYQIGDIVKAKNSHKECGYRRGDTLRVEKESMFRGDYRATNLTRGCEAYIGDYFRGKKMNNEEEIPVYQITILGIPIFSVKKVVRYE